MTLPDHENKRNLHILLYAQSDFVDLALVRQVECKFSQFLVRTFLETSAKG